MDLLEQLREFQTAMALFDAGVNLPGQQVQARQEAQGTMPFVFIVPAIGRMLPRHRRKVRCHFANGLNPGLLVQRQDRHQLALIRLGLVATLELFLQDLDLPIDHQDLGHLGVEFGVAPLQVILDLVRPKLGAGEQLGDGAPPEHGQAGMPGFRSVFSGVERQDPGCPEFFGVAQVDRLRTGYSHEPSPILSHI